ncbi:unnamed protein product [Linum tenue]|uniref:Uncharacterized protein n=1 Tax=Linum tenue TaxID=586396 RepID=A0AAV0PQR7_9ROSI|nr:unnamed protein product [Linum tenue]
MSLNCLTCQPLTRTDSDREYEKIPKLMKKNSQRVNSSAPIAFNSDGGQPKLVRSSGMRRDWSFENLRVNGENYLLESLSWILL